ncbi:cysteine desulfurase [Hymenobacter gummosus]|uniref:Cysteine desulfurase n=1 Tax=Hymenobacter gummosus TaxID=1776032 RepID=A0A3S0JC12_9BACT|nr:cysteine desulfurase family protein [Hymenobacter gummosus]RTQ47161.1 cysteine desulfurase [Hymenobacter gummosus]
MPSTTPARAAAAAEPRSVYFDNAASTPLDPAVLDAMLPYLREHYGNASSQHSYGRRLRGVVETARRTIAGLLNAAPNEIFFTSGGTESDNYAAIGTIRTLGLTHAISSPLEHHAVLHTLQALERVGDIRLSYVRHDAQGRLDLNHLEELLTTHPRSFVSLMHANNELGNLNDVEAIGRLCVRHNAIFHTDTVQTMGHYRHNVRLLQNHFLVGSAHKFHGPKGTGFLYRSAGLPVQPLLHGGSQERHVRPGTENIPGIVGLAKALEIAYQGLDEHRRYVQGLKDQLIRRLQAEVEGVQFNGLSAEAEQSLYTILSVSLPPSPRNAELLSTLDLNRVAVSGGSACTSGDKAGSHVLSALGTDPDRATLRLSLSRYNTADEVEYAVAQIANLFRAELV